VRPELAIDIARAIWMQSRFDDLDAWYEEVFAARPASTHPGWERVHRDRVTLAANDGDTERAILAARRWMEWDPSSLEAMRRLSLLLVEQGMGPQIDEGIALIHRTLEIEVDNPAAWRAIAVGHARAGRMNDAEAALHRTVELAPEDWRFWQGLGDFQRGMGRDAEAAVSYDRSTRLREGAVTATPSP